MKKLMFLSLCFISLSGFAMEKELSNQNQPLESPSAEQIQKRKELEQKEVTEATAHKRRERQEFFKSAVDKMSDTTKKMILHGNVLDINNDTNTVIITTAPGETEVGTQIKRDIESLWFSKEKKYDTFLRCSKSDNPDRPVQCTLQGLDLHSLEDVKELRERVRASQINLVDIILAPWIALERTIQKR